MNSKRNTLVPASHVIMGLLLAWSLSAASVGATNAKEFHYDTTNVETAVYWAAISNLANAIMLSGLGEVENISMTERDDWLRRSGYVTRPPMPEMAIVGPVYRAGSPAFPVTPDFTRPETLTWNPNTFDRTLAPGAQAWALLKITSPEFHLQYHELPENKLAGLMMIPQARTQARLLEKHLRSKDGLFVPRSPNGQLGNPEPRDQAAVLWAISNLILASTSDRDDYWHKAYRELVDPDDYRSLATDALEAVTKLPPRVAGDRAIVIEALGRYALASEDGASRLKALTLARAHADALRADSGTTLENIALTVYGLSEAGRLLQAPEYSKASGEVFVSRLLPLWDEAVGVFRSPQAGPDLVYTTTDVGAVIVALNSMRWYGPEQAAKEAQQRYPRFFEVAVVQSGLLRASPLPLVSSQYLKREPAENFAHPRLPLPKVAGTAPVFAAEVTYRDGAWTVSDPSFRTDGAMFLANMLAMRSGVRADPFLPGDRLATLR